MDPSPRARLCRTCRRFIDERIFTVPALTEEVPLRPGAGRLVRAREGDGELARSPQARAEERGSTEVVRLLPEGFA